MSQSTENSSLLEEYYSQFNQAGFCTNYQSQRGFNIHRGELSHSGVQSRLICSEAFGFDNRRLRFMRSKKYLETSYVRAETVRWIFQGGSIYPEVELDEIREYQGATTKRLMINARDQIGNRIFPTGVYSHSMKDGLFNFDRSATITTMIRELSFVPDFDQWRLSKLVMSIPEDRSCSLGALTDSPKRMRSMLLPWYIDASTVTMKIRDDNDEILEDPTIPIMRLFDDLDIRFSN